MKGFDPRWRDVSHFITGTSKEVDETAILLATGSL